MNRQTFYHNVYEKKNNNVDFDESMREADKAMYIDKSNIKKAVLASGGKLHRRAEDC